MAELAGQLTLFDNNENYQGFVDKFKAAKTTDDCYTSENVYEAVAGWVAEEYHLERERFMRPFYPGGDYEYETYPEGVRGGGQSAFFHPPGDRQVLHGAGNSVLPVRAGADAAAAAV